MRKNIYQWHRRLSLIIAIPVVLWASSGFMHPVMTNLRPQMGTQWLPPQPIDSTKLLVPLREVLLKNNIDTVHNVRIVKMVNNWFYQVQLPDRPVLQYFSTQTGMSLKKGDELYARYLAKQFLQGTKQPGENNTTALSLLTANTGSSAFDCCLNTTVSIMTDTTGTEVTRVTFIQQFDDEYKYINRLLPAYKVDFDRADGIRIYVETSSDRFAFAVDNKRAALDTFFRLFHTMGWLDFFGKGKLVIEIVIMLMAFLTTLMGIYIFFITKTKKPNGNELLRARRNHRWTSIVIALFTLMFTGSGAFHALEKFKPDTAGEYFTRNTFPVDKLQPDMFRLYAAIDTGKTITDISLVSINDKCYWQVFTGEKDTKSKGMTTKGKDLMKDQEAAPSNTAYVDISNYSVLEDGEKKYAESLAALFSGYHLSDIVKTELILQFTDEYGFVNKRLPVWKVNYASNNNERFYVETSSGKLAAHITDKDLIEGYSFAFLHKHHFMDFSGKTGRDISTMVWATAQIIMAAVGLILFFKIRKKRREKNI